MRNPDEDYRRKTKPIFSLYRIRESVVLLFVFMVSGYLLISCSNEPAVLKPEAPSPVPAERVLVKIDPNLDFTSFKHAEPQHQRLPCMLCHVRNDNSSKPKLTGHLPCAGCHVQQFADKNNGICTICHTGTGTADLKAFPGLGGFGARFDHAKHLPHSNCSVCHKPSQNGRAYSIPTRSGSHVTCFQCHTSDKRFGEKDISSCQTCHQAGNPPPPVSESAQAFRVGFSHANHKQNCTACHKVRAGSARGNQVTALKASMHFPPRGVQSCASCHNNKTAFGGDDFKDCRRCHKGNSYKFP